MSNWQILIKVFLIKLFKQPVILIKIEDFQAEVVKGRITNALKAELNDIFREDNLLSGVLFTQKNQSGRISIKGSSEVTDMVLQKIRNIWNMAK